MIEQAEMPKTDEPSLESATESAPEQVLVKFIAIGYTKEGRIELVTSDNDDSRVDTRDVLLFQKFLDSTVDKMLDNSAGQMADGLKQIYEVSMRTLAKVDMLEAQINSFKK